MAAPEPVGVRAKGSLPFVVRSGDARLCGFKHGAFRERAVRKLWGRIREANRQFFKCGKCAAGLVDIGPAIFLGTVGRRLKSQADSKLLRLRQWRASMSCALRKRQRPVGCRVVVAGLLRGIECGWYLT